MLENIFGSDTRTVIKYTIIVLLTIIIFKMLLSLIVFSIMRIFPKKSATVSNFFTGIL